MVAQLDVLIEDMSKEEVALFSTDDLVYLRVVELGGSFTAARGENFANNVARAVAMPHNISYRDTYEAVCRLVQKGRLVRRNTKDYRLQYGSLARPSRQYYNVAVFTAVS